MGFQRRVWWPKWTPASLAEAVAHGHVKVWLEGRKLKGGYALTRFKTGKDEAWLLVKADDEEANATADVLKTRPESALSGRNLEEIAAEAT